MKLPKFVEINNALFKLSGKRYYSKNRKWSIGYKIVDSKLISWQVGEPHLHAKILNEATEEDWRDLDLAYSPFGF